MSEKRLSPGLIQVYTGDGKGKTTCALGLALRAVGQGLKAYMVQFLKGRVTGESQAAARLAPELTLRYFGRGGLVNLHAPAPEDLVLVQQAWELARAVIGGGVYDLVILDEINLVLAHRFIDPKEALAVFKARPAWVELVLTGRRAPAEVLALADLVTEMRPLKHYYQAGVRSRRGIEW